MFPESIVKYANRSLPTQLYLLWVSFVRIPSFIRGDLVQKKKKTNKETPLLCYLLPFITSNVNNWISLELINPLTKSCLLQCRRGANNGAALRGIFLQERSGARLPRLAELARGFCWLPLLDEGFEIMQLHVCVLTLVVFKVGFPSWTVWMFVHPWACKLVLDVMDLPIQTEECINFSSWKIFSPSD